MQMQPIPVYIDRAVQTARRVSYPTRAFWNRVTEGLEMQDLWGQFKSEARTSYVLYSREVAWESIRNDHAWRRPFRIAWALFGAMLMKLSPARRVLLLAAIIMIIFSGEAQIGNVVFGLKLELFGAALLFLLLALELADRVTMKRDLEIAREIQRWLVPASPPAVQGMDISFFTRPANTVAGDYYDAFLRAKIHGQPPTLLLAVADVAGKSVPAAMLMATFQASLRALQESGVDFPELVRGLNCYACANSLNGLRFTTAFLAQLNVQTREMLYVCAGHNPPILRRREGAIEKLDAGGLPFGIETDEKYECGTTRLETGDLLVIYTDGVVDAVNSEAVQFGEERWREKVASVKPSESAAATLSQLAAYLDSFVGSARQHDDITCLIARVT